MSKSVAILYRVEDFINQTLLPYFLTWRILCGSVADTNPIYIYTFCKEKKQ